jgi:TatD DNase family protein
MESVPSQTASLRLIDSHAHVDVSEFDADRDAMLERARAAGVETILAIGGNPGEAGAPGTLASAIPFAEQYDWIYAAAGIHPHEASLATDAHCELLSGLARHPKFLGWGEIGLDYHYDHSPRDSQQRVFAEQLALARAARKPVIIHCREAWPDCLEILNSHWRPTGLGGIFHCFGGSLADARQGADMGFLVSFAGNITYPKAQNLRDVAAALPIESILIETDSPFLAPQPHRGRRNEPAYVAEVARTMGIVRNLPPAEAAAVTAANFRRFFRLEDSAASGASDRTGGAPSPS